MLKFNNFQQFMSHSTLPYHSKTEFKIQFIIKNQNKKQIMVIIIIWHYLSGGREREIFLRDTFLFEVSALPQNKDDK